MKTNGNSHANSSIAAGYEDVLPAALGIMKAAGADRAQAMLSLNERTELSIESDRIHLLRTAVECELVLKALVGGKKGVSTGNSLDSTSVVAAANETVELANSSPIDEANAISPYSPPLSLEFGPREPDRDAMYGRLSEFLSRVKMEFPFTTVRSGGVTFVKRTSLFNNSNGVEFIERSGYYSFGVSFATKDGRRTSSLNYTAAAAVGLDSELMSWGNAAELLRLSAGELDPGTVDGAFEGTIVIAPDCLREFLYMLSDNYIGDGCLMRGTSPFKDRLGTVVASPLFTLRSAPRSLPLKSLFTPDGFEQHDSTYIENGVLRGFQLSLYGSNRTGLPKAPNSGYLWTMDPGTTSLDEMIASIDRGLLLYRFSGNSSPNGDFSGVAKNSLYIENGRVVRPVKETMVSGNLGKLLERVSAVSRDRIEYGNTVLPWVLTDGVTISSD